jgi:hypothetical protein
MRHSLSQLALVRCLGAGYLGLLPWNMAPLPPWLALAGPAELNLLYMLKYLHHTTRLFYTGCSCGISLNGTYRRQIPQARNIKLQAVRATHLRHAHKTEADALASAGAASLIPLNFFCQPTMAASL